MGAGGRATQGAVAEGARRAGEGWKHLSCCKPRYLNAYQTSGLVQLELESLGFSPMRTT